MDSEAVPLSSQETRNTPASPPASSGVRKSGRVSRKPDLFSQGSFGDSLRQTKRKHHGDEDEEEDDDEESGGSGDDDDQGSPDEEEVREKKRAAHRKSAKKPKRQTKVKNASQVSRKSKSAPSNGVNGHRLAIPPARRRKASTSRPKKAKAKSSLAGDEGVLYGM